MGHLTRSPRSEGVRNRRPEPHGVRMASIPREPAVSTHLPKLGRRIRRHSPLRAQRPDGHALLAGIVRTLLPAIESGGIATAAEVEIQSLRERIREQMESQRAVFAFPGSPAPGPLSEDGFGRPTRAHPQPARPRR